MLVLANVLLTTARSVANRSGGIAPPSPHLADIEAHARPLTPSDYKTLPAGALETDFVFSVEVGTNIVAEDVISSVVLIDDEVTPWAQSATNTNETLRVVLAQDWTPGPLTYRNCYVKKVTGGGLAY